MMMMMMTIIVLLTEFFQGGGTAGMFNLCSLFSKRTPWHEVSHIYTINTTEICNISVNFLMKSEGLYCLLILLFTISDHF